MKTAIYVLMFLALLAGAACAGTAHAPTPGDTASPEPTAIASPTSIRDVDFSQVAEVSDIISRCQLNWLFFGETTTLDVAPCSVSTVSYADLGVAAGEEAVIEVSGVSGMGREPVVAVLVFGYGGGALHQLLLKETVTGPLTTYIAQGRLAISESLYGPEEPACCPTHATLTTYSYAPAGLAGESETVTCGSNQPPFGTIVCERP